MAVSGQLHDLANLPMVEQPQAATSEDAGWAPELIYTRICFDNEIPTEVLKRQVPFHHTELLLHFKPY